MSTSSLPSLDASLSNLSSAARSVWQILIAGLLVAAFASAPAAAQESANLYERIEPAEWGEVSKAILAATDYPADSNAAAVILSDVGSVTTRFNLETELERHVRIKLLTESSYDDQGTVEVPYYAEDGFQRVVDVKAVTYVLNENGEIEEHELDDDTIFEEERGEGYAAIKFTLPNLAPGAVIEYSYKLRSESLLYMPPWNFQSGEPTMLSEYRAEIPDFVEFAPITKGAPNYSYTDQKRINSRFGKSTRYTWAMTDVPALREEPFMTTPRDYRSSIALEPRLLRNPDTGVVMHQFMKSWPEVAEQLLDADFFGGDLGDGDVEDVAETIVDDTMTPEEKVQALYSFVQSNIKWNGYTTDYLTDDMDKVIESRVGNSGDVNLFLTALLQSVDLEAHPALTSTRSHGRLMTAYPIRSQFNYAIAAVRLPDAEEWIFLDATEPMLPMGMLPVRALNDEAWIVREDTPIWQMTTPKKGADRRVFVNGTLSEDGTLNATVDVTDQGYQALEMRKWLKDSGDAETLVKDRVLSIDGEATLTDASIDAEEDLDQPLKTTATVEIPQHAMAAGGRMYVSPVLSAAYSENPFRQKTRTFPVDFGHTQSFSYTLSLQLPEGYEVEESLKNRRVGLPGNAGMFMQVAQVNGSRLVVRSIFKVNVPDVRPEYYGALREFFAMAVSGWQEQIVLKKSEAQTEAGGETASPTTSSSGDK